MILRFVVQKPDVHVKILGRDREKGKERAARFDAAARRSWVQPSGYFKTKDNGNF